MSILQRTRNGSIEAGICPPWMDIGVQRWMSFQHECSNHPGLDASLGAFAWSNGD